MPARQQCLFDHFERGARGGGKTLRFAAGLCAFGDGIERRFGCFDLGQRRNTFAGVHCLFDQRAAHRDQFAQQRQIVNLLRQFARRQQALPVGGQARQIGGAAQFLQPIVGFEIGLERDRGYNRLAVDQRGNARKYAAMHRGKEMLCGKRAGHFLKDAVVDQHRAQKRGLCLDIGGQGARGIGFAQQDRGGVGHAPLLPCSSRTDKPTARDHPVDSGHGISHLQHG